MKRQNLRFSLILISFLLFPITIYYFSPALIIMGAAEGVIVGSFVTFGLQFLISLLSGRAFCGWLCPAAGLQEICFHVNSRRIDGRRWTKFLIWLPWLAGIGAALWAAGGVKSVQPLYQIQNGISVAEPSAYIVYYGFVALIVALALSVGKRAFCHHVCWMAPFMMIGTKLRDAFGLPSLRIRSQPAKCTKCGTCVRNCPMSLDVQTMVRQGVLTHSDCILCGACVDGCPKQVLGYTFRTGRIATPGMAKQDLRGE